MPENNVLMTLATFRGFHWLGYLDLHSNGLRHLATGLFQPLQNLLTLDLADNLLTQLEDGTFLGLRSLQKLNLNNNRLVFLSRSTLHHLPKLQWLIITNNPDLDMVPGTFDDITALSILNSDAFRFCCVAKETPVCTPAADEFSSCNDLMSNSALQISIWVLGVIALVGNVFVVAWRIKTDRQKVSSFFIINLGLSDGLMGVYLLIIASVDVYYRGVYILYADSWRASAMCQVAGALAMLSSEVSVYMLTIITLDRALNILYTRKVKVISWNKAVGITIAGWLGCLLLTILPVVRIDYFQDAFFGRTGKHVC